MENSCYLSCRSDPSMAHFSYLLFLLLLSWEHAQDLKGTDVSSPFPFLYKRQRGRRNKMKPFILLQCNYSLLLFPTFPTIIRGCASHQWKGFFIQEAPPTECTNGDATQEGAVISRGKAFQIRCSFVGDESLPKKNILHMLRLQSDLGSFLSFLI